MTRVVFLIPTPLRPFAGGRSRIEIDVAKEPPALGDALEALGEAVPGVRDRVLTEQGEVREHINVFIDSENVRFQQGLATQVPEGSTLVILAAVSGG